MHAQTQSHFYFQFNIWAKFKICVPEHSYSSWNLGNYAMFSAILANFLLCMHRIIHISTSGPILPQNFKFLWTVSYSTMNLHQAYTKIYVYFEWKMAFVMQNCGISRLVEAEWKFVDETKKSAFLHHFTPNEPLKVTFHLWCLPKQWLRNKKSYVMLVCPTVKWCWPVTLATVKLVIEQQHAKCQLLSTISYDIKYPVNTQKFLDNQMCNKHH